MARDHRRLRVFNEAHQLVLAIYQETRSFPRDEWFGIRAQVRRAAVSIARTWLKEVRGAEPVSTFISLVCHADLQRKSRI